MAKILVAEDEDILMMLIQDTLEDEGHKVTCAQNGVEAYEKLQHNEYDLVILDFMMPGLTGLEVVEKTRNELKKSIKMMILSAKNQLEDQKLILQAGADYFMTKPFSPQQLIVTIEDIVHG